MGFGHSFSESIQVEKKPEFCKGALFLIVNTSTFILCFSVLVADTSEVDAVSPHYPNFSPVEIVLSNSKRLLRSYLETNSTTF